MAVKAGELEINTTRYEVNLNGSPLQLSPKEFAVLSFLVQHRGIVFSREELVEKGSYDYEGFARTAMIKKGVPSDAKMEANVRQQA